MSGTRFLSFNLVGPIAAWGDVAVGEVRPTRDRPGKGAITGLIGSALGVDRTDLDGLRRLRDGVGFAVRIDRHGHVFRDYRTAQRPDGQAIRRRERARGRLGTRADELAAHRHGGFIRTTQHFADHVAGGSWTVVLWAKEDEALLEEVAEALRRPKFTLFLGRKACPPSHPPGPRLFSASGLSEALAGAKEPPTEERCGEGGQRFAAWEDSAPEPAPEPERVEFVQDWPSCIPARSMHRRREMVGMIRTEGE